MNDVIIIGAGAAGLSAALWCDELGLNTLILESAEEIGGQLLWIYNRIENHLGVLQSENGLEMRDLFAEQIKKRRFKLRTGVKVLRIDAKEKTVFLENGEQLQSRALILATGIRRRKLNVSGEDAFRRRGVLKSGKLDSDSVLGKSVCVVGGGDAAAENALILAEKAMRVFLIHRQDKFRARNEFLQKIQKNPKIEILPETIVKAVLGKENLEAIELQKKGSHETFQIKVDALLIRIGVEPNTELLCSQIELDKNGYIQINHLCETSVENVFAVGDVANPLAPTISSAVGMGATAAKALNFKLTF